MELNIMQIFLRFLELFFAEVGVSMKFEALQGNVGVSLGKGWENLKKILKIIKFFSNNEETLGENLDKDNR